MEDCPAHFVEQIGAPETVYDNPASPFVYQFLGNVNLFHSRVHEGWAHIGEARVAAHGIAQEQALVYVRPHEIALAANDDGASLRTRVTQVRKLGPVVRLELESSNGDVLDVELTREHFSAQPWQVGDTVYARPKQAAVFAA